MFICCFIYLRWSTAWKGHKYCVLVTFCHVVNLSKCSRPKYINHHQQLTSETRKYSWRLQQNNKQSSVRMSDFIKCLFLVSSTCRKGCKELTKRQTSNSPLGVSVSLSLSRYLVALQSTYQCNYLVEQSHFLSVMSNMIKEQSTFNRLDNFAYDSCF